MHATVDQMTVELDVGDLQTRGEVWGGLSVRHCALPAGSDLRPLFVGLPGDRCDCPHWGYVVAGSITIGHGDGTEEVTGAGEVFYWPGGHTAWTDPGVVFVEFSPAEQLAPVLAHLESRLSASPDAGPGVGPGDTAGDTARDAARSGRPR